jgi:alpha-galactosidase
MLHGVVAGDRREALIAYVALGTSATEVRLPARLPGLDPRETYEVELVDTGGEPFRKEIRPPEWTGEEPFAASGRFLGEVGLPMPGLGPEQALVLHVRAV